MLPMNLTLIAFNCRYTHSCLSLFYVRQELLKNLSDAHVSLHQFTINDPYYATLINISDINSDAYFFSVYIWNATYIKRLIDDLARIRPETPIIIGGPQAKSLYTGERPNRICLIEGEIEGINNDFYSALSRRSLSSTYQADRAESFLLPYDAEDFSNHLANRHIYYESSRGCPYSCSYCLSASEPGIRNKPLAQVKTELAAILRHCPQTLRFVDRTFNASAERTLDIWQLLLDESKGTTFHFEISPDLFSDEMFSFLGKIPVGLFQFEIGIQSTNPQTLSAINRKTNINKIQENIKRLVQLDSVHLHVDLILGLPFETAASFKESFNTVFAMRPHYIQMGLLKILPNTPISRQTNEYEILHCALPPYETLATRWLTNKELTHLYWLGECMEAFYNNRYFISFFTFLHQNNQSGFDFFTNLLKVCREFNFFKRAKTQRLMSRILFEFIRQDPHRKLFTELLRFDWLRSGHRFLPDHLDPALLGDNKKHLWAIMPQEYPPLYTQKTRNTFFKKSLFLQFSSDALRELNVTSDRKKEPGVLCFLTNKEKSVFSLNQVTLMPDQE